MLLIVDGDVVAFRSAWNKNCFEDAVDRFEEMIEEIRERCFATEVKIAIQGVNNFRTKFFPDYKNTPNRHKAKANNPYFMDMRNYLIEEGLAEPSDGMEADDLVHIWAKEARDAGMPFVVASIDKDLLCIEGTHYLIHKNKFVYMDKDEADIHYWIQILTGDGVDNIRGLKGIGPKKAQKILEGYAIGERKQAVINAYYEKVGDKWREEIMHTGTLIHILPTRDGHFKLEDNDGPTNIEEES